MLRSSSEEIAKLIAKLPKHQNLIIGFLLTIGLSLGTGLLLGQLMAEGKLFSAKPSFSSRSSSFSARPIASSPASNVAVLSSSDQKTKITNINTASILELDNLPGIGLTYAQKIISGRPYVSTSDLLTKKIIPLSTYSKLKAQIGI